MTDVEKLQNKIIQDAGYLWNDIAKLAALNANEPGMRRYSKDLDEALELIHGVQRLAMADHGRVVSNWIWFRPFGAAPVDPTEMISERSKENDD